MHNLHIYGVSGMDEAYNICEGKFLSIYRKLVVIWFAISHQRPAKKVVKPGSQIFFTH